MMSKTTWILAALAAVAFAGAAQADEPAWIAESNANARPLLEVMAKYNPETAAALGVDGHDGDVADLKPGTDTRFEADSERVAQALEAKLATATDPRVKQDLQILVDGGSRAEARRPSSAAG